ncbi:MAG: AAA family ATPase, partial [Gammaproteobacteria bacterium]
MEEQEKVAEVAEQGSGLAIPTEFLPPTLYLIPLYDRPFFPPQTQPVLIDEAPWLDTIKEIGETPQKVAGLILAKENRGWGPERLHAMGTAVRVHHPMRAKGKIQFIAEGIHRFRWTHWISKEPPLLTQVVYPEEPPYPNVDELKAYAIAIINTIKELLPLNPLYSEELKFFLNRFSPNEPSALTDFAASLTTADKDELQDILETLHLRRRMEKVLVLLKKEVEVAKLQAQIRQQVEQRMTEQQRRFFLKEQLKAIQKELGIAKDDKTADIERFKARIERLRLPEEVQKRIQEELDKLSVLELGSPEYAVTRNYLDWLTSLPWGQYSRDNLDLSHARRVLDEDHDGLEDIKARIIEFLAVGVMKGEVAGSVLLFVGPPGVGKTSIGRSIARALERRFYRFSLGGMRDEAEIKGHRRTYIGAMPGKFIQAIKAVGTANPVLMLDEIDKVGTSFRGDPASALLEVLDPEQNSAFLDHYLDVPFDLSKVLFICTANQLDTIPPPLLDRMEVIHLAGYI